MYVVQVKKSKCSISWNKLCRDKKTGGLGIKKLQRQNIAMLAKWWWKGKKETGKLWHTTLTNKYGEDFLDKPHTSHDKTSTIMKSMMQLRTETNLALFGKENFHWILGNGTNIQFWNEIWWNKTSLSLKFKRLFSLATDKTITVRDAVSALENQDTKLIWRRQLRGWELLEEQTLVGIIKEIKLQKGPDRLIWNKGEGDYTPKRGYMVLEEQNTSTLPWTTIWKQKVPPKVKTFICLAAHNALPTLDYLSRIHVITNNECSWCMQVGEDTQHLF